MVDPIPRLEKIVEEAGKMSDAEFHQAMATTFLNLRDFHTNYLMPKPYSCHVVLWPLVFDLVQSSDLVQYPKVAVKSFSRIPQVMNYTDIKEKVQIGDVLVKYNGKTFKEYFDEHKSVTGGANSYGGQRSVLNYLSYRSGRMFLMPEETEAEYVLRRKDGKTYSVKAPLVVRSNTDCIAESKAPSNATKVEEEQIKDMKRMIMNEALAVHPFLDDLKSVFEKNYDYKINRTSDSILSWSIYSRGTMKIGIILLDSFVPASSTVDELLQTFRGLLVNELKDTDALLIDVRNNGGGYVTLSDSLPQFFTADYIPPGARSLVSETNGKIFNSPSFNNSEYVPSILFDCLIS